MGDDANHKAPSSEKHWQQVYETKAEDTVSWFQKEPELSMALIGRAGLGRDDAIIDIGGGASALVDHLLDKGYRNLSVLDISAQALDKSKTRLAGRASLVTWIKADVTTFESSGLYVLWHDRAAFHFLGEAQDRARYLAVMEKSLRPGGHAIIATFALEGPERCSGLPVTRYSARSLAAALGAGYELLEEHGERHRTPWGSEQQFLYTLFRKRA